MAKVEVYSTQVCPYCVKAKNLLSSKGAEYTEIDVSHDAELRDKMVERAGGMRTVPQIFINDQHIGGSDDLHALDTKGELDALLAS